MFKFAEGDAVALVGDYPNLGLSAGAVGTIWVMYTTTLPCYEVTWQDKDGLDFDMTMEEEELAEPGNFKETPGTGSAGSF